MIEEGVIAIMLIWLIGQVEVIRRKLKYFNDRITEIEEKLRSCGIVALREEKEESSDM